MKKILFMCAALILLSCAAYAQQVNEKVQIDHNGTWYDGKILKVEDGKYYVSYDGWSDSWNEWVDIDHIKGFAKSAPLSKFKVGDKVEVEYGMIPEPATVTEIGENKYHIKYDKSVYGDKWVTEKQMKKL